LVSVNICLSPHYIQQLFVGQHCFGSAKLREEAFFQMQTIKAKYRPKNIQNTCTLKSCLHSIGIHAQTGLQCAHIERENYKMPTFFFKKIIYQEAWKLRILNMTHQTEGRRYLSQTTEQISLKFRIEGCTCQFVHEFCSIRN
jgi:hypothetical protein